MGISTCGDEFRRALIVMSRDSAGKATSVRWTGTFYWSELEAKERHGRDFIRLDRRDCVLVADDEVTK